jgi:hypothetical protein
MDTDKVIEAAQALYFAGVWTLQDSALDVEAQKKLWQDMRDALGLKPGASTLRQ